MALGLEVAVPDSHLELEIQLLSLLEDLVVVAPSRGHVGPTDSACCSELPALSGTGEEQQTPPVGGSWPELFLQPQGWLGYVCHLSLTLLCPC